LIDVTVQANHEAGRLSGLFPFLGTRRRREFTRFGDAGSRPAGRADVDRNSGNSSEFVKAVCHRVDDLKPIGELLGA
jgi:hypothetical protein